MASEPDRLIYVEFRRQGRTSEPSFITADLWENPKRGHCVGSYDRVSVGVEWCRRDQQCYAHVSGSGSPDGESIVPSGPFWAAKNVILDNEHPGAIGPRLKHLPRRWPARKLLSLAEEDIDCYWCQFCEDWLPYDHQCEHAGYCEVCEDWVYPDEPCGHKLGGGECPPA